MSETHVRAKTLTEDTSASAGMSNSSDSETGKRIISYPELVSRLGLNAKRTKKQQAKGRLPQSITEHELRALVENPPDWLLASQKSLQRARELTQQQSGNQPKNKVSQSASFSRPRPSPARTPKTPREYSVSEVATELNLSQTVARDLILVTHGAPGKPKLSRAEMEGLTTLSTEELAQHVATARASAPLVRAQAKAAAEQLRAAKKKEAERRAKQRRQEERRVQRLEKLRSEHGIETAHRPEEVRVVAAAEFLRISDAQVRARVKEGRLDATRREVQTAYGWSERIYLDLEQLVAVHKRPPKWLETARSRANKSGSRERLQARAIERAEWQQRQAESEDEKQARRNAAAEQQHERKRRHAKAVARAKERVRVNVPVRSREPESVTAHIGPTNSGKTHQGLAHLRAECRGVYAAPLRFLAREAYERLSADLGAEKVGLVTGEERINEEAPVLCVTAEMAPLSGHLLVLDEVHWAADRDRGSAWARLLCAGDYRHIHLASAVDALPLLRRAFPQARTVVHERLNPLHFIGTESFKSLSPGTALVAFSRKAVIGLASELVKRGASVAALYGAMPVETRRRELERFTSGEAHILCTTDVIGHGVNLPSLRTVLFAETQKFDGVSRRALAGWEIAQIAGRAGRYGYEDEGRVGVLTGNNWFNPDAKLVKRSLVGTVDVGEGLRGHRSVCSSVLRPRLRDLRCDTASDLGPALSVWCDLAASIQHVWLNVDSCAGLRAQHKQFTKEALTGLTVEDAWKLMNAPADPQKHASLFGRMTACVLGQSSLGTLEKRLHPQRIHKLSLEEAESLASEVSVLRWFAHAFPEQCPVTAQQAAEAEDAIAAQVVKQLRAKLREGSIGRCSECGRGCAPWFTHCDPCHRTQYSDRDFYDFY